MPLSPRLLQILEMIPEEYDLVWDTCCDHGYLGQALLERNNPPQVNFVDCVPHLIDRLEVELKQRHNDKKWACLCADVTQLELKAASKQLVVIAGVGGDHCATMLRQLVHNHPGVEFDLLLCPVHHSYYLRQQLHTEGFNIKNEHLVYDNRRYYEVIYCCRSKDPSFTPCGELIWQQGAHSERYLQRLVAHYQRKASSDSLAAAALFDYQQVRPLPKGE